MVALPPLRIVYWTKVFGDTWNGGMHIYIYYLLFSLVFSLNLDY